MSAKHRRGAGTSGRRDREEAPAARPVGRMAGGTSGTQPAQNQLADGRVRFGLILIALVLATIVVIGADWAFSSVFGNGAGSTSGATATATSTTTAQGVTSHWTDVTANQLADMLSRKDFTLVNVKTPYMGEIDGTDLYIPYDQLAARKSELPADKGAKILVYCRTGTTSAIAAQTLLDLGYTNVWNLSGGMTAWTNSGRQLVQKNR